MMRGRPAVYATFSSYDEVAHHSGLERADTLEALRKLDEQFGRIDRARRFAPRPYKIVVLSDHGQTQGATFKQRNGYDLQSLVERSLHGASVSRRRIGGDETRSRGPARRRRGDRLVRGAVRRGHARQRSVVLGSGNLGLIYLMEANRRLTLEEIERAPPASAPGAARATRTSASCSSTRSEHGPVVLGAAAPTTCRRIASRARTRWPRSPPTRRPICSAPARSAHAPDILINSFYDAELEQGCAFEELISFHGGLGGPQTRPFILHPVELPFPEQPIVGAASVHDLLVSWRRSLAAPVVQRAPALTQGPPAVPGTVTVPTEVSRTSSSPP